MIVGIVIALVFVLMVASVAVGLLIARAHYRGVLCEMHQVHELCEASAFTAGFERGLSEKSSDLADFRYREGFRDGRHAEQMHPTRANGVPHRG